MIIPREPHLLGVSCRHESRHRGAGPHTLFFCWLTMIVAGCTPDRELWAHPRVNAARSVPAGVGNTAAAEAPSRQEPALNPAGRGGTAAQTVLIQGVPFIKQKPDFCGEACVAMVMGKLGRPMSQEEVFNLSGVDPALGRGALAKELVRGVKGLGFDPGKVWYHLPRRGARPQLEAQFKALVADLRAEIPSILCMHYDEAPGTTQHFRLVVGYDSTADEVIYQEPAIARGGYQRMARETLLKLWPLPYKPSRRILVRIPLRPAATGAARAPGPRPAGFTAADYAQHVMGLRPTFRRLGGRFTTVIQPPFVVAGDGWRGDVRRHAAGLIKWSVEELKKHYFPRDPAQIITIWLFKDRKSYTRKARLLTGEDPGTPFGFYSPTHRALVMNIKTGGGTLVHEIVHPLMEANFPACPPWFNEGMGSLYEGVGRRNGKIWGYLNWRLPRLQAALRAGRVPPFQQLMAQSETQFYTEDPGTNYGQSRYLLYYLQHKGLLREYYRQFLKHHRQDPTGYQTLRRVLEISDMDTFQRQWAAYTLKQKYVRPAKR